MGLGSILKELIDQERFACIDELETSLHPDLVSFILNAFLMNSKQTQLLATTHVTDLMDLEYMRSDMILLCEKKEDGSSEYYQA